MTDPFAQMIAERYPRLARHYAEQLRLSKRKKICRRCTADRQRKWRWTEDADTTKLREEARGA